MSKSKPKSKADEARQFLDDLDKLDDTGTSSNGAPGTNASLNPNDAGEVFKFIDEITQKSSEPTAALERPSSRASLAAPQGTMRRATERVRVGSPAPPSSAGSASKSDTSPSRATPARTATPNGSAAANEATEASASKSGWGWGTVWSSASAALQQARTAVDEGVKHLPTEQAQKWRDEVLNKVPFDKEQLEKIGSDLRTRGFSTFNEILNVVAPPISEHEVIQVWSSHDMEGYEGVESLVYKALARVMEQIDGGDLIVNKGHESKPREKTAEKNLNAVEGLETAFKLAEANVEELIKSNPKTEQKTSSNSQVPTTYSSIYLRLQPFYTILPIPNKAESKEKTHLQFMLYLSDPEHQLAHSTVTQAVPATWVDQMESHEWIEDVIVDALRIGMETIGQEYIVSRMRWLESDEDGSATEVSEKGKEVSK